MNKKECKKVRRAMLLGCLLPWSAVDENDNLRIADKERCAHLTSNCPLLLNPSVVADTKAGNCSTVRGPCNDRGAPLRRGFLPNSATECNITAESKGPGGILKKPLRVVMEEVPCPGDLEKQLQSRPMSAPTPGSRELNKVSSGKRGKIEMKFDKNGQIANGLNNDLPVILKVEKDDSQPKETLLRITYCKRSPELKDGQSSTKIVKELAKDKPGPCRLRPCLKLPSKCPSSPTVTEAQKNEKNAGKNVKPEAKGGTNSGGCASSSNAVLKISCSPKKVPETTKPMNGKSKSEETLGGHVQGKKKNLKIVMEELLSATDGKIKSALEIKFDEDGKGSSKQPLDAVFAILEARKSETASDTVITIKYLINARPTLEPTSTAANAPEGVPPSISRDDDDDDYIEPTNDAENDGQAIKEVVASDTDDDDIQDVELNGEDSSNLDQEASEVTKDPQVPKKVSKSPTVEGNEEGEEYGDYDDDYDDSYDYDDDEVVNPALINTKAQKPACTEHIKCNAAENRSKVQGKTMEKQRGMDCPPILAGTSFFRADQPRKRILTRRAQNITATEGTLDRRFRKSNFKLLNLRSKGPITNMMVNQTHEKIPRKHPVHTLFGLTTSVTSKAQTRRQIMANASAWRTDKIQQHYKETRV